MRKKLQPFFIPGVTDVADFTRDLRPEFTAMPSGWSMAAIDIGCLDARNRLPAGSTIRVELNTAKPKKRLAWAMSTTCTRP